MTQQDKISQYQLGVKPIEYLALIAKDGDSWGVMIGNNLMDGVTGFGKTIPEALRALACQLE